MQQHFFGTPWAIAGDKTAIPTAQQADGSASYAQGFGPDYEKELGVDPDAKPVPRDLSNQLYFDLTQALGAIQTQGAPEYVTAADNGGTPLAYPRGAIVRFGAPGRTFISRVDANTDAPNVAASWAAFVFEVATQAEAVQGVRDDVIVTPLKVAQAIAASSVSVPPATESAAGIAPLATQAEANAGADDSKIITPLKLGGAVAQMVPAATTTTAGRVALATTAEVQTGTSSVKAVTPSALKPRLDERPTTGSVARFSGLDPSAISQGFQILWAAATGAIGGNEYINNRGSGGGGHYFYTRVDSASALTLSASISGSGRFTTTDGFVSQTGVFYGANTARLVTSGAGGAVYLRPNGDNSASGEFLVASNGNAQCNGALAAAGGFQNGSSRTVKDHLASLDAEECLAHVLALRPVRYRYTDRSERRLGYYAEEVREEIPEAVSDAEEGAFSPLLLEDAQMLPDHTGAIQALAARLEVALARIKELENAQRIP